MEIFLFELCVEEDFCIVVEVPVPIVDLDDFNEIGIVIALEVMVKQEANHEHSPNDGDEISPIAADVVSDEEAFAEENGHAVSTSGPKTVVDSDSDASKFKGSEIVFTVNDARTRNNFSLDMFEIESEEWLEECTGTNDSGPDVNMVDTMAADEEPPAGTNTRSKCIELAMTKGKGNSGEAYVSPKSWQLKSRRERRPLSDCRLACKDKVAEETSDELFCAYLSEYALGLAYMHKVIRVTGKPNKKPKKIHKLF